MMNPSNHVETVKSLYAAFGRGDIPMILSRLDGDATMDHQGPPDVLPWAHTYRGPGGWGQFFTDLAAHMDILAFEPREFVAEGDKVVAFGRIHSRARKTGRTADMQWAMLWSFRHGKVAGLRVFDDTHGYVAALGGNSGAQHESDWRQT